MRALLPSVGALLLALCWPIAGHAQPMPRAQEPLVEQVRRAIDRGVKYLRQSQRPNGSWELDIGGAAVDMRGGWSALSLLALLNAGVPANDPAVARGLDWLRGIDSSRTYVRSLQTMVFAEAGLPEDRERIKRNVDWLIAARIIRGGQMQGWTYGQSGLQDGDGSNTQYALLGLYAGKTAGVRIPPEVWESIRSLYIRTQLPDGGWLYSARDRGPRLTMTTAGLCGLLIAGAELNAGRERPGLDGTFNGCGVYKENEPAARALRWINSHFTLSAEPLRATFYNLYGLERTGRLSGLRFFGAHDWYREGCIFLVKDQQADGSWRGGGFMDQWPVVSTSFSLLFLSKGRTPVLISKLVHGPVNPRQEADTDWNNDRNDLRNLTEFCSRELFKKMPLAWQTFDIYRALEGAAGDELEVTGELLQSPILYLTGHKSPLSRLHDNEKELLKKYVENGGFIIAEACCGSAAFDKGFRELVRELWPDNDLTDLPAEHAIWKAHFPVPPGSFGLQGLNMGCKTVLVYSPQDLSCLWESNRTKDDGFLNGRALLAFRAGANLVAYATGMEPPRPRLTEVELAGAKEDRRVIPRGFLKAAQLKHGGDWQPAPQAMRNLLAHLHKLAGLDVSLKTEALTVTSDSLVDFKFLYMHGRRDFGYRPVDLDRLRFNLKTGGLLLADACCGSAAFDAAFRKFARQLFPEHKLERVPPGDELFGKDLNGEPLTEANLRCRRERAGPMQPMAPWLEGIKVDGRWVVLYSKYDLGCALERKQSSDCIGYDHTSALRVGSAAVLYLLRP